MKEYGSYNNSFRHYREYKQHQHESLENKKKPNAKVLVSEILLSNDISKTTRSARVNAFVSCLGENELRGAF